MKMILLHDFLSCLPEDELLALDLHAADPRRVAFYRVFYQAQALMQHPAYVYLKSRVVTSVHVDIPEHHLIIGLSLFQLERNFADSTKDCAYCANGFYDDDNNFLCGTGSCDPEYEDEIIKFWLE